jgi:hypothetical protein
MNSGTATQVYLKHINTTFRNEVRSVSDEVLYLDRRTEMKRIGAFYRFVILTQVFAPEECPTAMTILCKCFVKIGRCCSIIL